jgi:hypothetical protein
MEPLPRALRTSYLSVIAVNFVVMNLPFLIVLCFVGVLMGVSIARGAGRGAGLEHPIFISFLLPDKHV